MKQKQQQKAQSEHMCHKSAKHIWLPCIHLCTYTGENDYGMIYTAAIHAEYLAKFAKGFRVLLSIGL